MAHRDQTRSRDPFLMRVRAAFLLLWSFAMVSRHSAPVGTSVVRGRATYAITQHPMTHHLYLRIVVQTSDRRVMPIAGFPSLRRESGYQPRDRAFFVNRSSAPVS